MKVLEKVALGLAVAQVAIAYDDGIKPCWDVRLPEKRPDPDTGVDEDTFCY